MLYIYNMEIKYQIILEGGSIEEIQNRKINETLYEKEEAFAKVKSLNKTITPGEKQYFGLKYKAKKVKIYKLKISHSRRGDRFVDGNLEELTSYFSYTLEIGHSWDKRINKNPKTIKSLVTNLQNAFSVKEGACYERTFIDLVD